MSKRKSKKNKKSNYADKKNYSRNFHFRSADSKDIQDIAFRIFGSTYYTPKV